MGVMSKIYILGGESLKGEGGETLGLALKT